MTNIRIEGARVHHLKNVTLDIPRGKFVVLTGPSGSGKSSLAFDTLYAEGQRQYIESLAVKSRQFLQQLPRPDVDAIHGLQPTIAVDQRIGAANPRSTVATLTDLYDYLRLLFAKVGTPHCFQCGKDIRPFSPEQIAEQILALPTGTKTMLLAPIVTPADDKKDVLRKIVKSGFVRARIDGQIVDLDPLPKLDFDKCHNIEAIIDRLVVKDGVRQRLTESLPLALQQGDGNVVALYEQNGEWRELAFSTKHACPVCHIAFAELEPRTFSFNSPYGACPSCGGTGFDNENRCPECHGTRLRKEARHVTFGGKKIYELCAETIEDVLAFFKKHEQSDNPVTQTIVAEIVKRLEMLQRIGLDYLTLDRPIPTLSGGERQRARLAASLGSALTGVCYVIDEPSVGLHPRENARLIDVLRSLQRQGNSVIVVEHDETIIRAADHIIELGPGAGRYGGSIVNETTDGRQQTADGSNSDPAAVCRLQSAVSPLSAVLKRLTVENATLHNLKNVTVSFPLGCLTCVIGVSGSGKSSLVNGSLVPAVLAQLSKKPPPNGNTCTVTGVEHIDKLIRIDQSPLGRSSRSNPATYSGVWDEIRNVFTMTKEAKQRGYNATRFSFNAPTKKSAGNSGVCETCLGEGVKKIEVGYMPDIETVCPACNGKRFNAATLQVFFKGKNIADMLEMSISESVAFFKNFPTIFRVLSSFERLGLGYLALGQPASTLSGGESQRVKLATELAKTETGKTLYVLDEPTTGLHKTDVAVLLNILRSLVGQGNTVITIEHHLDVIRAADWVIELGPEGGNRGGYVTMASHKNCAKS